MRHLGAVLALGFALGLRHALDPDHLAAVAAIVSRSRRFGASWLLGAFWGLGHTATVFAAGCAIILLRLGVPERLGAAFEFLVGAMLAALGLMNLYGRGLGLLGIREHAHEHAHGDGHAHAHRGAESGQHSHRHAHSERLESLMRTAGKAQLARAFGAGLVHGLAGSTAVALLVLAAIPEPRGAVAYLAVFGLGTLLSMAGLSTAMEAAMLWAARRFELGRALVSGAGAVSLGLGLYIMYEIAAVGWTPR